MAIKISGINSGLDTDSMVKELVSAYSTKKDKYVKAQTKLAWTQDAWKATNTKVYSFYTNTLSALRYSNGYNVKRATCTNSAIASVKASSSAVSGTQSLSVLQLAAAGYLTGGEVKDSNGKACTAETKLSELGVTDATLKINGKDVKITGDTTLSSLATSMRQAGVTASYDAVSGRFFIGSSKSGADSEFTITAGDTAGIDALKKLGLMSLKDLDGNETADMIRYRKMAQTDAAEYAETIYDANKYTTTTYKTYLEGVVESAQSAITSAQNLIEKLKGEDYKWEDDYDTEEEYHKAITEAEEKVRNNVKIREDNLALLEDDAAFEKSMNEANAKIHDQAVASANAEIEAAKAVLADNTLTNSTDSARITAQDSIIKLNGATFRGTSNSFSINGLTIEVNDLTVSTTTDANGNVVETDNPVKITTSVDTQAMYDKIKNLFSEYNDMISYIDGLYYADSASGYEPLTDDEKDAMTDTQIEEWEKKIKDSLLRRDTTLGNISSALKTVMVSASYTASSGKTYNLASLGIATQGYFSASMADRGKFHIDGDADDALVSSNSDKLLEALTNDPEGVTEFFQNLSQSLYTTLSNKMASSSVSSAFTIYNDKEMSSQYSDYKEQIEKWEEKIESYEETWYNKFSKMESALATLQSQTSALSSMLGNG